MNNIENIEIFVGHNWDNLSDEFKSDWAALAKQRNKDTGEVDQDLLNKFVSKHKSDFMHNKGGEIVDLNAGKPLVVRLRDEGVDFSDTSSVYDQNLARKFNVADPNTVRETRAKEQARLEKEAADKKRAEEYKKREQERYARQKAVDEYKHEYRVPFLGWKYPGIMQTAFNGLADLVISDDTKKAIVDDPNNSSSIAGNAVADIAGTGADFLPGWGQLAGPAIRTGRDIAVGKNAGEIFSQNAADWATAGVGAKFAKGVKMKGIKDDAIDVTGTVAGAVGSTEAGEAVKTLNKGIDIAKNADLLKYTAKLSPEELASIAKMSPKEWAAYVASHADKPEIYNMLDKIGYEQRNDLLKTVLAAAKDQLKFVQNDLPKAIVYKEQHPWKYKATEVVDKAAPYVAEGANKVSHITTRVGTQSTPYKTSDPSKMKAEREQDVIDWYKENYADTWAAGFKPKADPDDPIMKAWVEGHSEGKW